MKEYTQEEVNAALRVGMVGGPKDPATVLASEVLKLRQLLGESK